MFHTSWNGPPRLGIARLIIGVRQASERTLQQLVLLMLGSHQAYPSSKQVYIKSSCIPSYQTACVVFSLRNQANIRHEKWVSTQVGNVRKQST